MKSKFIVIFLIAWSGVYKVDSCTFDGHSYNVLEYNTSAEHINVDNINFYNQ